MIKAKNVKKKKFIFKLPTDARFGEQDDEPNFEQLNRDAVSRYTFFRRLLRLMRDMRWCEWKCSFSKEVEVGHRTSQIKYKKIFIDSLQKGLVES